LLASLEEVAMLGSHFLMKAKRPPALVNNVMLG